MSARITALFVASFSTLAHAQDQDISKVYLNRLYVGSFAQVLDEISIEHEVKFSFDREVLAKRKVEDFPNNLPLEHFLKYWCALFDLSYFVSEGKVIIQVTDKTYSKKKRARKNVPVNPQRKTGSYPQG